MPEILNTIMDDDKKELQIGIKIAMRDFRKQTGSIEGQSILISDLCFLLPAYSREDIVSALQAMKDMKTLDTATELIYLPKHYFE